MQTIGVRELQEQTGEVLRRVREEGETFEVTDEGKVVARLVPAQPPETPTVSVAEFWERWDRLSEEISAAWPEGVSAVEAIREQRRDL